MTVSQENAFASWSSTHFTALIAISVLTLLAAAAGRRTRSSAAKEIARRILAGAFLVAVATGFGKRLLSADGTWEELLPIHMCYVSLVMTVVALATLRRLPFEFAYFFGIGGTIQALLTPDVVTDFPSYEFVAFFAAHGGILVGVAFLMNAYGLKPQPGAVLRMVLAGNVYLVVAGLYNALAGTNYGYLCRKPDHPSLLDHMGPWPWYILGMELVGLITLLLLNLPFVLLRRRQQARSR